MTPTWLNAAAVGAGPRKWNQLDMGRLAFVVALVVASLSLHSARAQNAAANTKLQPVAQQRISTSATLRLNSPHARPSVNKGYYIEFRARNAQSYGHTFSIFGRLNGEGDIVTKEVAGLHPFTESAVPWMIGHLIAVPSETGASDGDTEDEFVIARFRLVLNQDEYRRVTTFIKQLQQSSPVWHAALYNCNAFVGTIARFMGLTTPASTLLVPAYYVDSLRDLNISRKDIAGVIGTPVQVADAAQLRAEALKALGRH